MVGKVPKGNTDTVPSDFAAVVEASAAGAGAGAVDAMVAKQRLSLAVYVGCGGLCKVYLWCL